MVAAFSFGHSAWAADGQTEWPGFRGPSGDGTINGTGLAEALEDSHLDLAWKIPIGSGYSGISIAGDLLVTMFSEAGKDVLAAFLPSSGKRLWTYPFADTYGGHDGSHDGPVSTPLIVMGKVFGLGPHGQFFALDAATGKEVWATDLVSEHGIKEPFYGFGTSPLLWQDVLVLELGGEGSAVGGFDPASGEKLWTVGSGTVSYQTPLPWTFKGKKQLVAVGDSKLFGLDPSAGELLWEVDHQGRGGRGSGSMTPVATQREVQLFLAHQNENSTLVRLTT
jgi:outer membrane protein assembly factor BamB